MDILLFDQRGPVVRADNPVVRRRKAGLVRRITRHNPALILFMANLVRLCVAHNDEPLLILQTAQLHLDTSRNQFIPIYAMSLVSLCGALQM